MLYNLFIAYDLVLPGQRYEAVRDAIRALGRWHQFQQSLFYVSTEHPPEAAFNLVRATMDAGDKLAVINAQSGVVSNGEKPLIDAINAIWFPPA